MQDLLDEIQGKAIAAIDAAKTADELESIRIIYLSRKGKISDLFDWMKNAPVDERPAVGKMLNQLRAAVQKHFDERLESVKNAGKQTGPRIDVTLPGRTPPIGSKHPITQTMEDIESIFTSMGFTVALGPEIEDDYHNFEALNFAPDHPARDMQDTFFINKNILLRTHTTPVQVRAMEAQKPPIRIIMPGRVYRNEAVSARSYCLFHQVDGLYVDQGVTFSELKGTLVTFAKQFYGSSLKYRFRPSFFPFTEPSAEMDITCYLCNGKGCRVCKYSGWLEILGCGMVDPNVFGFVGYDAEKYSGYAFGMGVERITMLRVGIDDIRILYDNDVRFLQQFS